MLIKTEFMGPTNTKGGRLKVSAASSQVRAIILDWQSDFDIDANHSNACEMLAARLVAAGAMEPVRWIKRWDRDGACIHVGLYPHELT